MDPSYTTYQQQVMMQEEQRKQHRQQQPLNSMSNMYMQQQPMHRSQQQQHVAYPMQQQPMMLYPNDVAPLGSYDVAPVASHLGMSAPPVSAEYGYYDSQTQTPSQRSTNIPYDDSAAPAVSSVQQQQQQGGKRHAPRAAFPDYKTPPQFLYVKDKTTGASSSVASTETQMRNLRVAEDDPSIKAEHPPSSSPSRQPPVELDMNILSKLLGTDPSLITRDQVRNILSNPDLLNIYKKLLEEDQRKKKRLARNRDLAGQRRKRSKELVETYEAEVNQLENILAKSLAHEFGQGDIQTLLEALGGEHKQSITLTKDAKHQQTASLLAQLLRHALVFQDANDDSWMLALAACDDPEFLSLKLEVGLTDAQCRQLARLEPAIHAEATKVALVEKVVAALHAQEWLHFPNSENLVDLFRGPLNDAQLQKFVQWTRVNHRVIHVLQVAREGADAADKDDDAHLVFDFPADM
ncbi:hypothetical protein, variant 1 [Aphanomyces astaci]|uniref:BZIP domain-containing protein n=1 Tax=Aphanomyces astaci TaxID=112090 RepID=W4FIL6_APHAT|nr:hypothetical protein, variant 1 [Aphanomyces astaci]ETV66558.1 hypothetical protein, variant 1 [Aphanomyces astaci]|eukprot:XP_009843929.1 hypothetical protein, variant 1 [Aphanomyces astaci]